VVAADTLAKRLDPNIMFKPWFQIEAWAKTHGVAARSSNYELYGNLSARIAEILGRYSAWQEVYSIDESFIRLTGTPGEIERLGREIRSTVMKLVGVPVRVAAGASKSLAKVAAIGIKQTPGFGGSLHMGRFPNAQLDRILDSIPVTELWGIAGRSGKRLAGMNIHTARQLRDASPKWLRKKFNVNMERIVLELRGISCIPIETIPPTKKDQFIFSRSFSHKMTALKEMEQVLSLYAQRVSERLRAQGSVASHLSAWAMTGWADEGSVGHSAQVSVPLETPTDDPIVLTKAARALLPRLDPVPGIRYARAGVVLTDVRQAAGVQPLSLFSREFEGRGIGQALDRINRALGDGSIGVGLGGIKQPPGWEMKRAMLSKRATTHWSELPVAVA